MRRIMWMASCVWLLAGSTVFGSDLVRDGRAVGEFVLASDAERPVVFAVNDVRHWIQEMTGAKVPALSEPSAKNNMKVFIGESFAGAFEDDLAKLADNDGFAIREQNGDVYVFGSRPRGTMYGVFALLEKNSDIIWARPHKPFGTIFGQHGDLALTETDVLDIPVFWYRSLGGGHPFHRPTGKWQLRNRNNQTGRGFHEPDWDLMQTIGTNLSSPLAEYGEEHPEYFGYDPISGERKITRHGEGTLCLTYPGLAELWAEEVVKEIRAKEQRTGRKVDVYFIGPGDNWFCCRCEDCTSPIDLPADGTLEMKDPEAQKDPLFRSTQIYMFLNEAMKTLKQEVPHVKIAPLAYIHMAEPPAVAIDPDMLVYFAPYPTNTMHFPLLDERQHPQWRERFKAWMEKTPNLGFYEYFYSKPSPLAFYAGANLKALLRSGDSSNAIIYAEFDNDRGRRGIGENALGWDVGAMNTWVIARLFWDPTQDVDALYRYYIQRTYREAAPQMIEYYEMIRESWLESGDTTTDGAHASIFHNYKNMIVDKGLETKCMRLLSEAEDAAQHPHVETLVRRMRERYESFSKSMNRLIAADIPELGYDGDEFRSVQWEKPMALEGFKVVRRAGEVQDPSHRTTLKAGHDGQYLYIRFTAYHDDVSALAVAPADDATDAEEVWPRGDYGELWFTRGHTRYVFAFDCNGKTYDAKMYDRTWDSDWRVVTRKTDEAWEAIAIIPLAALSLEPGEQADLQWMARRAIDLGRDEPEQISYEGAPLYSRFFPVVVE